MNSRASPPYIVDYGPCAQTRVPARASSVARASRGRGVGLRTLDPGENISLSISVGGHRSVLRSAGDRRAMAQDSDSSRWPRR